MKKTFSFAHPKKKRARVADAIKYEVKKYVKRENKKELPEGADYWDFDCMYGSEKSSALIIHISEINKYISKADSEGLDSFYLEVVSKPGVRQSKPKS
ncbi:MAG: hypothetical protein HOM84_00615 [Thiotrichales bacterium]|jgi:hypothetical protein|nr:hypothetical protein [Thiotrichales bacterium]MBT3613218.1 hypothetical protein [Thiotrichales bacterium]MBT3751863.1 hypothetical protein [Thiotrichales bacterium]MBT3837763.1 hypothetical protein [Thiotrichales bacterium]MBT4152513.1 hypothetical protein [Thiotrichales bacterium]